jgi:hypothetical protein
MAHSQYRLAVYKDDHTTRKTKKLDLVGWTSLSGTIKFAESMTVTAEFGLPTFDPFSFCGKPVVRVCVVLCSSFLLQFTTFGFGTVFKWTAFFDGISVLFGVGHRCHHGDFLSTTRTSVKSSTVDACAS